jgi:hypothetical protein
MIYKKVNPKRLAFRFATVTVFVTVVKVLRFRYLTTAGSPCSGVDQDGLPRIARLQAFQERHLIAHARSLKVAENPILREVLRRR